MGIATIVTLVGVGVIVAALALYLITIASALNHVSFTVGTVIIGVKAIADACAPIGPVVRDIAGDLAAIDAELESLVTGGEGRPKSAGRSLPHATAMYGPNTMRGW